MAYNYAYGRFPAPNNSGMMNPPPNIHGPPVFNHTRMMNRPPNIHGPPVFNSNNNHRSWGPPPQRPQFNINSFMLPPHVTQMPNFQPNNMFNGGPPNQGPPRQHFTPDNTFSQGASNGSHENFPFNNNNGSGFHNNGKHFQHQRGRGRGFMGGHPRGQGVRGGFRGGKQNGNHNNFNNIKKEKVNKKDLAQNNVYFCDSCDRGFKTQDKYQEHVAGHIKCSYKDCPYIAAPKLVHLHARMQHSTGLAKVWDVKSAEEIQKWREERKKNFPTADNVAKKKQERQDRIARGEVLHTKNFGKMWRGRGGRGGRGQRGHGKGRWRGRWRDYDNTDKDEDFTQAVDGNDSDSPPDEILITKSIGDEDLGQIDEAEATEAEVDAGIPATELQAHKPASEIEKLQLLLTSYGESTSDSETSGDDCTDDQSPVGTDTNPAAQSTVSPSKLVSPQKPALASSVNGVSSSSASYVNGISSSSDSSVNGVSSSSCTLPFVEQVVEQTDGGTQEQTTSQSITSSLESSQPAVNGVDICSVQKSGSPSQPAVNGVDICSVQKSGSPSQPAVNGVDICSVQKSGSPSQPAVNGVDIRSVQKSGSPSQPAVNGVDIRSVQKSGSPSQPAVNGVDIRSVQKSGSPSQPAVNGVDICSVQKSGSPSQPAVNAVDMCSVQKSGSPHKLASHDASPQTSSGDPAEASPSSVSGQHQKLNDQRGPSDKGRKGNQGNKRAPGPEQGHEPPSKKKKGQTSQPVHKYTLLEKLLAPGMRRERNKVLQCAHYIVKNRFFDKELS